MEKRKTENTTQELLEEIAKQNSIITPDHTPLAVCAILDAARLYGLPNVEFTRDPRWTDYHEIMAVSWLCRNVSILPRPYGNPKRESDKDWWMRLNPGLGHFVLLDVALDVKRHAMDTGKIQNGAIQALIRETRMKWSGLTKALETHYTYAIRPDPQMNEDTQWMQTERLVDDAYETWIADKNASGVTATNSPTRSFWNGYTANARRHAKKRNNETT